MKTGWCNLVARVLLLGVLVLAGIGLTAQPATALSLNPFDFYDLDYHVAISDAEVEPGESFSVQAGATVRCIRHLPLGINEAYAKFKVVATHLDSGEELILLEQYDYTLSDVPDWRGQSYSSNESVDLSFPSGATNGTYAISAVLQQARVDGFNVIRLVPQSYRDIEMGTIVCSVPEDPAPPPTPQPTTMTIAVLEHEFKTTVDENGILSEGLHTNLIDGLLSLRLESGTRCLTNRGDPLTHISVSHDLSPRPYSEGVVLSAFRFRPDGARFTPALNLGISYDPSALPPGSHEDDLFIARYDRSAGAWHEIPSTVDHNAKVVSADVAHFSTFGLLVPVPVPGPARFALQSLEVSPQRVAPRSPVYVSITIENTGESSGQYPLVVEVNDVTEYSQDVDVTARQSRTVQLTLVRSQPGDYEVRAGELSRSFTVLSAKDSDAESDPKSPAAPGDSDSTQPGPTSPGAPGTNQAGTPPGDGGMASIYVALLVLAAVAIPAIVVLALKFARVL